jgi:hypothetical protein
MVRVCARTISILFDVCTTSGDAKTDDSYASDRYKKVTLLLQQRLQFLLLLHQ